MQLWASREAFNMCPTCRPAEGEELVQIVQVLAKTYAQAIHVQTLGSRTRPLHSSGHLSEYGSVCLLQDADKINAALYTKPALMLVGELSASIADLMNNRVVKQHGFVVRSAGNVQRIDDLCPLLHVVFNAYVR